MLTITAWPGVNKADLGRLWPLFQGSGVSGPLYWEIIALKMCFRPVWEQKSEGEVRETGHVEEKNSHQWARNIEEEKRKKTSERNSHTTKPEYKIKMVTKRIIIDGDERPSGRRVQEVSGVFLLFPWNNETCEERHRCVKVECIFAAAWLKENVT